MGGAVLTWRVEMTIFLSLLTFIIVAQGAWSRRPWRLDKELDLDAPGSLGSIYNSVLKRHWFNSSPLLAVSETVRYRLLILSHRLY